MGRDGSTSAVGILTRQTVAASATVLVLPVALRRTSSLSGATALPAVLPKRGDSS